MLNRRSFLQTLAASGIVLPSTFGSMAFAQEDGTLYVAVVSDPATLDPAMMASFFEVAVQYNIHEPLIHVTAALDAEPGLATAEVVDELTYVLTLREGLTFHDGTVLDAAAVKANFDRMMDPATASPRASDLGPVASVEVTDPLTVTVRLTSAYAPFLQVLSNRAGMMVSPTAVAELGEDFATKAVGAGPYKVASWTKNAELVLEAFPGYWRGEPAIKRVVFRPISDETVRLTNLRSGTVQIADGIPPQSLSQVTSADGLTLNQAAGLGFNAFSFNTTKAPFDDARVRRAFSMAVDPAVILQAAYFGTGSVAFGPIPPSIGWAFDPTLTDVRGDAAAAKALLEEAGVAQPVNVTITVTNSPIFVRIAEILQAQVLEAGFVVTINQIDATSLITVLRGKEFDLCMSPWSGRSDPDGNMFNYFTTDGPNNFAGWQSAEADRLLKSARAASAQSDRAELYAQVQRLIVAEAPMLFLAHPATLQASSSALTWIQYPDGALRLQFASLA